MLFEIRNRLSREILFSVEAESLRIAVELAIKSNTNLRYADLSCANLSYADLRYADLRYADLRYANLSYADLSYADLRYANLSYTDLSYAYLSYANLMVFQYQRHQAFYTMNGLLRIGCIVLSTSEWVAQFKSIGEKENYTDEQIKLYGQFINMCHQHHIDQQKGKSND